MISTFPIWVVLVASLMAAVIDVWQFRIPNVLTLPLIVTGAVYQSVMGGSQGLLASVGAICIGAGILLLPYCLGWIGAGDVKMMAGVGAWLGIPLTFNVLLASSVAAGAYAAVLLARYGGARQVILNFKILCYKAKALGAHIGAEENIEAILTHKERHRRAVPFGAMVAVGMVVVILWINW